MEKAFSFVIPQTGIDPNNDRPYLIGDLQINAVAYLFRRDGTLRTIDIISVTWQNEIVTAYIRTFQPYEWQQLEFAAENHYRSLYVASEKSADYCANS